MNILNGSKSLTAILLASCSVTALAQDETTPGSDWMLEEITVTAQKRAQSLNDVPISVNALTGEKIERSGVDRMTELQYLVPNFQVTETGLSTQMFMRGIGSGNNPAFEQSVAQYVDGVSYGRQRLSRVPYMDLARIEVLRGPQSILFGKNSVAGALSLITARPDEEFAANLSAEYVAELDQTELQGMINIPLSPNLATRIAFRGLDGGGYVKNTFDGLEGPDKKERAFRITTDWTASENLDLSLKLEYDEFDTKGRQVETVLDEPGPSGLTYAQILAAIGAVGGLTEASFDYNRDANSAEFSKNEVYNATLTADYYWGDVTISSITSYVGYTKDEQGDFDYTAADFLPAPLSDDYDQFSQELKLVSPEGETLEWIVGAFYQWNKLSVYDKTQIGDDFNKLGFPFSAVANIGGARNYEQTSKTFAAFAQLSWNISDRLKLTGGLRWTNEKKDATRTIVLEDIDGNAVTSPLAIAVYSAFGFDLENQGASGHNLSGDRTENSVTPSINIQYDASDDVMLYASYSRGFKGGGFDARGNTVGSFEFENESVNAYEAGLKSTLLDGRMEVNAALYRSDYSGLQVSQLDGGVGFNVGNANKARSQGLELETRIALGPNWTLNASYAYLDFEFTDFKNGNCYLGQTADGDILPGGVQGCDYTGKNGRLAAKHSAHASLQYQREIGVKDIEFLGALDISYKGKHNIHDNLDPNGDVDAYAMLDLRLGLVSDKWELQAFVRNLTDENVLTYMANNPLANTVSGGRVYYAFPMPGRTTGINLKFKF